jgi:hypothetical protein
MHFEPSAIIPAFAGLWPWQGFVTHVLLTRLPLSARGRTVRLACLIHAASVHPEPGSNSQSKTLYKDSTNLCRARHKPLRVYA